MPLGSSRRSPRWTTVSWMNSATRSIYACMPSPVRRRPSRALADVPPPGDATLIGAALVDVLREARASAARRGGAGQRRRGQLRRPGCRAVGGDRRHTVSLSTPLASVVEAIPEDIELEDVVMTAQVMPGSRVSAQVSIAMPSPAWRGCGSYDGDAVMAADPVTLPAGAGVTTHWVEFDIGDAGVKDLRYHPRCPARRG